MIELYMEACMAKWYNCKTVFKRLNGFSLCDSHLNSFLAITSVCLVGLNMYPSLYSNTEGSNNIYVGQYSKMT